MEAELYYTAPKDEYFEEVKREAMKLWKEVDSDNDKFGYATGKINRIKDIKNIDVLVPRKIRFAFVNIREQYSLSHCKHQFDLFNKIIIEKYPSMKSSIDIVNGQKKLYAYNMFVMRRELYHEYNEILFDVLFALEQKIKLDGMDSYQQRIFGFLSERFLNYFLEWKKGTLRIKELQVLFIVDELK